jgi:dTMP kinase
MFVVLEGCDAAGKNTQAKMLAARVDAAGSTAVIFSFPRYQTTVGEAILRHLKGEIMLAQENLADNANSSHERAPEDALAFQCFMLADKCSAAIDIIHAAGRGHTVICDRWWQSALAFGASDGLDEIWLRSIHYMLPTPNINIFIDVPPEEAIKRRPEARDRYERDREKQKAVRENYRRLWTNDGPDYVTIDGLGTPDEVHERIWTAIQERP